MATVIVTDASSRLFPKMANLPFWTNSARDRNIFNLWLACWENKEIGEEVCLSPAQLTEITSKFGIGNLAKTEIAAADDEMTRQLLQRL